MPNPIRLSNLERHFMRGETAVYALHGVDLTIQPGEFVALVGPSGSGKSTLLNLLGGLDRPSGGELWLNSLALHSADDKQRTRHRRQQLGFIFQSFNLLPKLTALENTAVPLMLNGVPKTEREGQAAALLEKVGLGHRLHHYPTELSGGEQQRVAIARALIHNPALILADEPTGNLDSATGAEVMALLQQLNQDQSITLIVVTHDEEVAAYADRIVKLRDGRVESEQVSRGRDEQVSRRKGKQVTEAHPGVPAALTPASSPSSPHLRFSDILRSALGNLRRRPVRNVLTAAGVVIGIITLVAMVSFGVGVQKEVQRNFETIGLENIFVNPRYAETDAFDPFATPKPERALTPTAVREIAQLPGVKVVTPILDLPRGANIALLTAAGESIPVRVSEGGEGRFSFGGTNEVLAGQGIDEGETQGIVLSNQLADTLLGPEQRYTDLIGQPVALRAELPRGESQEFPSRIVGVRQSFGRRTIDLGLAERAAITTWWFGQPDLLETEGYNRLIVRAESLGSVTAVIAAIEDMNFSPQSFEAILDAANQVLALLQALLGSVGALALLVAALGVANTMLMAIYERTREIGVLKALGASRREIRLLFMVEAGLIGLIGGFVGLILGALLGRLVDYIAHRYLIEEGVTGVGLLSVIPPWLALGALAFAALIGILAGLYPAARAARLDPVSALRHE
ncbi:MAG: ATP-binding cassette domain-containing protein [Anaerolineae bacterium]|nr:ATP-binding cassette domain-containing protein [Anaerolineae bacterium]